MSTNASSTATSAVQFEQVLDNLAVVHLQVALAAGRKKLKAEDLGIADPKSDLISLGSKKVFDPDSLAPFRQLRNEAQRICRQEGVRFLGSPNLFAIPVTQVATVVAQLDQLEADFNKEKLALLPQVDSINQAWQGKHTTYQQALKETFSREYFDSALNFAHHAVRIGKTNDPNVDKNLANNVGSLSDTLLKEISEDARETMNTSFNKGPKVSHRVLRPFKRFAAKLRSLGFLNQSATPLADFIEQTIASITSGPGYIEGADYYRLSFVCSTLADVNNIRSYLAGVLNQQQYVDAHMPADTSIEALEASSNAGLEATVSDACPADVSDAAVLKAVEEFEMTAETEPVLLPAAMPPAKPAQSAGHWF